MGQRQDGRVRDRTYIQNYNVDDPQVPGDSGDYNYASSPQGIAIHGNLLYLTDTGDHTVSVIDTATHNPKDRNPADTDIDVGIDPGDLAASPRRRGRPAGCLRRDGPR